MEKSHNLVTPLNTLQLLRNLQSKKGFSFVDFMGTHQAITHNLTPPTNYKQSYFNDNQLLHEITSPQTFIK